MTIAELGYEAVLVPSYQTIVEMSGKWYEVVRSTAEVGEVGITVICTLQQVDDKGEGMGESTITVNLAEVDIKVA